MLGSSGRAIIRATWDSFCKLQSEKTCIKEGAKEAANRQLHKKMAVNAKQKQYTLYAPYMEQKEKEIKSKE